MSKNNLEKPIFERIMDMPIWAWLLAGATFAVVSGIYNDVKQHLRRKPEEPNSSIPMPPSTSQTVISERPMSQTSHIERLAEKETEIRVR